MKSTAVNFIDRCKNVWSLNARVFVSAVDIVRNMLDESLDLVDCHELESVDGVTVVKCDQTLGINGAVIAANAKDPFGRPVVFVDNFFETLSPVSQEFVLWHEVGHTRDADLVTKPFVVSQLGRVLLSQKGKIAREEVFADDYAVARMGAEKSVFALNELLALTSSFMLFGCDREMKLRLDRIQAQRKI